MLVFWSRQCRFHMEREGTRHACKTEQWWRFMTIQNRTFMPLDDPCQIFNEASLIRPAYVLMDLLKCIFWCSLKYLCWKQDCSRLIIFSYIYALTSWWAYQYQHMYLGPYFDEVHYFNVNIPHCVSKRLIFHTPAVVHFFVRERSNWSRRT